jgi:hypothetical protein
MGGKNGRRKFRDRKGKEGRNKRKVYKETMEGKCGKKETWKRRREGKNGRTEGRMGERDEEERKDGKDT